MNTSEWFWSCQSVHRMVGASFVTNQAIEDCISISTAIQTSLEIH